MPGRRIKAKQHRNNIVVFFGTTKVLLGEKFYNFPSIISQSDFIGISDQNSWVRGKTKINIERK